MNSGIMAQNDISYTKMGRAILSRWYWLITALAFSLLFGTVYLFYQPPLFSTSACAKIEDKRSELSELTSIKNFYDKSNKIESEKFLIKSRSVMIKALNLMGMDLSFLKREKFRYIDIYPYRPLNIRVIRRTRYESPVFEYKRLDEHYYSLLYPVNNSGERQETFKYGQLVSIRGFEFIVHSPAIRGKQTYLFRFNNMDKMLKKTLKNFSIDETPTNNILNLRYTDQNPYIARDLLNTVLQQYLEFDKSQRSASILQTEKFIASLLGAMSNAVRLSGDHIRTFKNSNQMLNVSSSINATVNGLAELETQKETMDLQATVIAHFKNQFKKSDNGDTLNFGFQDSADPILNTLIVKHNDAVNRKRVLSKSYTSKSEMIKSTNEEITFISDLIRKTLDAQLANNVIRTSSLNHSIENIHKNISRLPALERESIKLESKFNVNQKILEFLAEKKLESQISRAAIVPIATIIDYADLPAEPTSPIPKNVYTVCLLTSLSVSTLLLIASRLLNPYVYNTESIESYSETPILGVIRKCDSKTSQREISVLNEPRSVFSESVRSVRAGLSFMAPGKKNKIICITSEAPGEGKSFVSLNIAVSLSLMQKKVLLIATDMRKSFLHQSFNLNNTEGLSKYLSGQSELHQILKKTHIQNLDFIPSGPVPPNPSELLHHARMESAINELRGNYDFIILDSAPIGIVADGKPLVNLGDINLFILRYGLSRKESILSPGALQKQFGLSNFAFILNGYEDDHFRYNLYHTKQTDKPYHISNQSYHDYNGKYY